MVISFFIFLKGETMRRLNGEKLIAAMRALGFSDDDLVEKLRQQGFPVEGTHTVRKWRKGTQPKSDRIGLIESILGRSVADDPKPRRRYGDFSSSIPV